MASDAVGHWLEGAGRFPLLGPAEEVHLGGLVRAWQDHPAGPAGAPPAIRRQGLRARDRIVRCNLRLVAHITDRARRRGGVRLLELEDALQVGAIGLQRAAERFDPARGYKFSTYAFWWIRQSIARESEVVGSTIRLPSGLAARSPGSMPGGMCWPRSWAASRHRRSWQTAWACPQSSWRTLWRAAGAAARWTPCMAKTTASAWRM